MLAMLDFWHVFHSWKGGMSTLDRRQDGERGPAKGGGEGWQGCIQRRRASTAKANCGGVANQRSSMSLNGTPNRGYKCPC